MTIILLFLGWVTSCSVGVKVESELESESIFFRQESGSLKIRRPCSHACKGSSAAGTRGVATEIRGRYPPMESEAYEEASGRSERTGTKGLMLTLAGKGGVCDETLF